MTDFSVFQTEQSKLIKGLVGRVLANGVVQLGVRDYFVADFIT